MPNVGNIVRFSFGTQHEFDNMSHVRDENTLYFITDTERLFVGETEYTRPVQVGTGSPQGNVECAPQTLYLQDTGSSQTLWYNRTGAINGWKTVSSFDNIMFLAKEAETSAEVKSILAGQIYLFEDWVRLKTVTGSSDSSSYLSLLDSSKACTLIESTVNDNQYATALSVYKWNRKVIELSIGQNLPSSWSTQNSYDPLGVLFVVQPAEGIKQYCLCVHRTKTSTQFYQPIYIELSTQDQLQQLKEQSILSFNNDPTSEDEGVLNQVIYSIESNSFFKCTQISDNSYTWSLLHTAANVTFWDYSTTSANHGKVPDTFPGELGDLVVMTHDIVSHMSIEGGDVWQCYRISWANTGPEPEKTYSWRKINEGVRCLWSTAVPDVDFASDKWAIVYCTVHGDTRAYQLTDIEQIPNPDYDPEEDPEENAYFDRYHWTRLLTADDYKHLLLTFDADPVSGQTSQGANYGELNQLGFSTSSNKFFRCIQCNIISSYPFNADVIWDEVDRVPKVTYWNYLTSAQHDFSADGEPGQLGDMIVITTTSSASEDIRNGGAVWMCYKSIFWADTQSTQYFWRELKDGVACNYSPVVPTSANSSHQFDFRWVGDPAALGQQDDLFRLFQHIGSYGSGVTSLNVWKEILTQNSIKQDISETASQDTHIPSAYAAKKYTDKRSGIHDVNPYTGKITTYDGEFHDESYGPSNQLYQLFDIYNHGGIFLAKDAYDPDGQTTIRLTRYDEIEDLISGKMNLASISLPSGDEPYGQLYLVRPGISLTSLQLYMSFAGDGSLDKRIAWYSDLENKANIEEGEITQDNVAWYTDPSDGFEIAGTYTLIGDMCFLRAHADLVYKSDAGWSNRESVYYTLPVAATELGTTLGTCENNAYSVATSTQQNQSVLEIRQLGSQYITSGGTVYFTLVYKYT